MTETAKVKSLNGDRATLVCNDSVGCRSCCGKGFCKVREKTYEARVREGLDLRVGDDVKVHLPGGQVVLSVFLVMILPLLLFLGGFLGAGRFLGVEGEGGKTLVGLLGLGGGFLLSFLYGRARSQKKGNMPWVVERS